MKGRPGLYPCLSFVCFFMTAGSDVSFARGIDSWRLMLFCMMLLCCVFYVF